MKLKNLKKNTVVEIKNPREYLLLMELAEKAGYRWNGTGNMPTYYNDNEGYLKSVGISLYQNKTIARFINHVKVDCVPLKKVIKFEVGDRVRIREDLGKFDKCELPGITSIMIEHVGEVCEITDIVNKKPAKWYRLNGLSWNWLKKWIEPVSPVEIGIGDMVRIIDSGFLLKRSAEKVIEMADSKEIIAKYSYGNDKGYPVTKAVNEEYKVLNIANDCVLIQRCPCGEVLLIDKRGLEKILEYGV